jgi:hypothetical protein
LYLLQPNKLVFDSTYFLLYIRNIKAQRSVVVAHGAAVVAHGAVVVAQRSVVVAQNHNISPLTNKYV